ncbi:unnamed protein product [Brachionus calyciflorus]|uniref:EF-hand domain-containing protein n=1 Tax=Brachionus calyciflorus TaxID=104777 RepID=A0A813YDX3_9BILA|nr:unnamed protein product [Brachionus calyciflorus]
MNSKLNDDQLKELKKCFDLFDEDKSGTISLKELKKICQSLKIKLNEKEAFELMRLMDKNNNGSIDFDEFVFIMGDKYIQGITREELSATFDRFDTDKNGFLNQNEFQEVLVQFKAFNFEPQIKKIMELFDKNRDNKIDRKEFIDFVMNLMEKEMNSWSEIPEEE